MVAASRFSCFHLQFALIHLLDQVNLISWALFGFMIVRYYCSFMIILIDVAKVFVLLTETCLGKACFHIEVLHVRKLVFLFAQFCVLFDSVGCFAVL